MLKPLFLLLCLIGHFATHAQSVKWYQNQVDSLTKIEQFEQVLLVGEQMRTLARDSFGTQSMEYYRAITRLSNAHGSLLHFEEARALRVESKDLIEKLKGKKFIGYATACLNLGIIDQYQSQFESAKVFMLEAMDVYHQLFGAEDAHFVSPMIQLGIIEFNLGNYAAALEYDEKSRALLIKLQQEKTTQYTDVLINLGVSQMASGEIARAEQVFRDALDRKRQLGAMDTTNAKFWLAKCMITGSKFNEAEPVLNQIIQHDSIKSDVGRIKVQARQELARLNQWVGRFSEGEHLLRESLDLEAALAGKETFQYALGLNQLSECLRQQGKFDEALRYAREALTLKEKIFGKKDLKYVTSLIEVGDCYTQLRQWKPAESTFLEAQSMLPQIAAYTADRLTDIQASLGDLYFTTERRAESRQAYQAALATMEANHYVSFSTQYARVKMMLGILAGLEGDTDGAKTYFSAYEKGRNERLVRMLPTLGDFEKTQFLAEFKGELDDLYSFQFRGQGQAYADLLLSSQLMFKNLATSGLESLVREMENTSDTLARADFERWRDIRTHIANMYALSTAELALQPDSIPVLENQATALEKSLARRSVQFAKRTAPPPAYHWQDLRAALQPGEVAVDIARFEYHYPGGANTDTTIYAFLVVTPDTRDQPALLFLPNGNELESLLIEQYRSEVQNKKPDAKTSDAMYNAFWKPLEPLLAGAHRVFVAPDGVFNKINLQTLRRPDGTYLLNVYDLTLVSNLKDIVAQPAKSTSPGSKTAFLLGNPVFQRSGLSADTSAIPVSLRATYRDAIEDRGLKLSPLPGSEKEVKSIAALFQKNAWTVTTALGKDASEESVKSAQSPRVMHLATHGYFLEDEHRNSQTGSFQIQYVGQNPLLRSMMFFAGAQNTLDHAQASGGEDGILTAYEAQNLNLENTDLVVLSACNTGLGKIENGEGVMGLQRALQIAGAKTVIMSLWSVDDAVAQLLMSTFYENWLAGKSESVAFRAAQQRVKEKYPQPFFWGAFVLVGN